MRLASLKQPPRREFLFALGAKSDRPFVISLISDALQTLECQF
jgi:hypothetical protein